MRHSLPIKLDANSGAARAHIPDRSSQTTIQTIQVHALDRSSQTAFQTVQGQSPSRPQKKIPLFLRKFFGVEFHIRKRERIARSLQQLLTENSAYKYLNARVKKFRRSFNDTGKSLRNSGLHSTVSPNQSSATNSSFGKKARRSKCMQIFPSRKSVRTPQVLAVW